MRNPRALTPRIQRLVTGIVSHASHSVPMGVLGGRAALAAFPLVAVAISPRESFRPCAGRRGLKPTATRVKPGNPCSPSRNTRETHEVGVFPRIARTLAA